MLFLHCTKIRRRQLSIVQNLQAKNEKLVNGFQCATSLSEEKSQHIEVIDILKYATVRNVTFAHHTDFADK